MPFGGAVSGDNKSKFVKLGLIAHVTNAFRRSGQRGPSPERAEFSTCRVTNAFRRSGQRGH